MVQEKELREYLLDNYYVCEGTLRRKKSLRRWKAGQEVGVQGLRGYKTVSILGKRYYTHRLIFLMERGYLPGIIDHIDGDKLNNHISNLQESSKIDNALNLRGAHSDNVSGFLGVTFRKDTGKYSARFRNQHLGIFDTPEEAHERYINFKANAGVAF